MPSPPDTRLAAIALALLLAGCGGGGGGGGDSAGEEPVARPPVPQTFELSGVITASPSQAVDSDTNDPARPAISNDSAGTAQPLANPVTLGGYVNRPGAGAAGRSLDSGDIDDFFQVDLLAGQTVTMLVADPALGDADLYLFDAQGLMVDFSIDTGNLERVVAPADGAYFVNAFAWSGATNYNLAIGQGLTTAPPASQTAAASIVPGEVIVSFVDETADDGNHAQVSAELDLQPRAGGRGRGRLLALRSGLVNPLLRQRRMGAAHAKFDSIVDPDLRARWETLQTVKTLRRDPRVRYAEPNYRVTAMAVPNDEGYPLQWHLPLIDTPGAWDTTVGDASVIVAVVDTGVLPGHPDLSGQLVPGYDFVRDPDSALDGDGIDADPSDPGTFVGGGSASFHGTHVTGTIAARGNNLQGVAGVAYGARVMPLRALGAGGGGTSYDVDQAVRFAAGLPNDSGQLPPRAADIINLSLGGAAFSQATQALFDEVRAAGVAVVAAAGNEASSQPGYPAAYDNVISVSAVDAQLGLARYSNSGATVDVAAPGGDNGVDFNGDGYPDGVLSTSGTIGGGINFVYSFSNGTSMAAPHVAGVLALMLSVNPQLAPADIDALLAAGRLADDLGASGRDDLFGHGLINARRAVLAALEASGSTAADIPRLVASASALNFGSSAGRLELTLRNGGGGELAVQGVQPSQPWLQISAMDTDDAGLGSYAIDVEREGLPAGIYTAAIAAQSSVNSLSVQVIMSVGGPGDAADVGVIYVLLLDPDTETTIEQFVSGGRGGEYPFRFSGVAPGEYEIIAGPDADNDLTICDPGEACGAWLTVDQPIRLQVQGDLDELDFPVEYQVAIPRTAALPAGSGVARPTPGRQ